MKKIIPFFIFLITINAFSQFSKTHYIPPLCGSNSILAEEQYLYISTPCIKPVNFKINQLGGATITGTVSQSNPYIFNAGYGISSQLHVDESLISTILKNKGYIIEAEDVVYVSARVIAGNGNQAGALVSKGLAALGTSFRIGGFLNTGIPSIFNYHLSFISILATENNTLINFSNIKPGVTLINNSGGNTPANIILNSGESYVLAIEGPNDYNKDGLIGSLVTADKPIAVNCGSYGGTNGDNDLNIDLGFDQIVSAERTGKEYILIKSTGQDQIERALVIANENNTEIYLNGNSVPYKILNAGEYLAIDGSNYSAAGNLYIKTTKNVFVYQSVGDNSRSDQANQELFFVPPLSCETPKIIDNIPNINEIGTRSFTGRITIVTEKNAALTFSNNGNAYLLSNLPATIDGPKAVTGNPNYETYTITGLSGTISVHSTGQLYLASYGSDGAATYGGFYSGFVFKPQITFNKINISQSSCIPNSHLSVSGISSFDTFQWYYNNVAIEGATNNNYSPTQAGYYYVKATVSSCGTSLISDKIPVSDCPEDSDNDGTNNNIDIDLDNDGIVNSQEANKTLINQSNPFQGSDYNAITNGLGTIVGKPLYGFTSTIPAGKNNTLSYTLNLNQPKSLSFSYISQDNPNQSTQPSDYMNSDGNFTISVPSNRTITVIDPNGQLLIDTNYDGVYESGVKEFSSFEIRFRLNSTIPLVPGLGSFKFETYLTDAITFSHNNLSETDTNKVTFAIEEYQIIDTDADGIPNLLDLDSDNDGILDTIEAQGSVLKKFSAIDTNTDGLDDAFEPGLLPIDTDADLIPNYLDLDSDNDGIYDIIESGSMAQDINLDGIIDGNQTSFGTNGLSNSIETATDSGTVDYTILDTDADNLYNAIDLDSDGDACYDVKEAGFTDTNFDGLLDNTTLAVDKNGLFISKLDGYTAPNINYITTAIIIINEEPKNQFVCELQRATFHITTNSIDAYQWEVSIDGINWNTIINNPTYAGANTDELLIATVSNVMNGYLYRVVLNKNGNSCSLISNTATLTIYTLPNVTTPIKLIQCDDDTDGISNFNLTEKNSYITADYTLLNFTYYTSLNGATTNNNAFLINNPLNFNSGNGSVWAKIENQNGCTAISQIDLLVSTTKIPSTFIRTLENCDDYIDPINNDEDGIATFDFSSVNSEILSLLPNPNSLYSIKYYTNEADALAETNAIINNTNYRNTNSPGQETIWVRVDSNQDNACYGLGPHIQLNVNPKPNIDINDDKLADKLVCSNLPSFYVKLDAGILDGSSTSNYTYIWSKDNSVLHGETNATLDVNTAGNYAVIVTSLAGCCSTRKIAVISSDIASIENISIQDLSDNNTITVNITGQGNYEYSIDDQLGAYQESNVFDNVAAGIHEVYVKDKNECGIVQKTVAVLGFPKFFTPNGDGYNDYWNLKGVNAQFNSKSIIYIYDRYGKLLKKINPLGIGWDGNYNNQALPSDDYWFTVKLENGREAKGHFSLKR